MPIYQHYFQDLPSFQQFLKVVTDQVCFGCLDVQLKIIETNVNNIAVTFNVVFSSDSNFVCLLFFTFAFGITFKLLVINNNCHLFVIFFVGEGLILKYFDFK